MKGKNIENIYYRWALARLSPICCFFTRLLAKGFHAASSYKLPQASWSSYHLQYTLPIEKIPSNHDINRKGFHYFYIWLGLALKICRKLIRWDGTLLQKNTSIPVLLPSHNIPSPR